VRIKRLRECGEFVSGDGCRLRELLNANTENSAFRYSLAYAVVSAGQKTAPHRIRTSEVYYILEGQGLMHIEAETAEVKAGDAVDIPPRSLQYIENTGLDDLIFLCIVDPAWRKEDEEICG